MFEDLDEFFDSTLKLPIGGKVYVIDSPDAATGLFCEAMTDVIRRLRTDPDSVTEADRTRLQLDDDQERSFYQRLLGGTYDQLLADKVPWAKVKHVASTTMVWVTAGEAAAERAWMAGDTRPEAPTPKQPQDHLPKASASSAPQGSPAGSTNPTVPPS